MLGARNSADGRDQMPENDNGNSEDETTDNADTYTGIRS